MLRACERQEISDRTGLIDVLRACERQEISDRTGLIDVLFDAGDRRRSHRPGREALSERYSPWP